MPSLTLDINPNGKLHSRILTGVRDRIQYSKRRMADQHLTWTAAEEKTLAFLPEREVDAAKRLVREGGKPEYTTIVVPYSYAILMASHTYWSTVFLGRNPIMQYAGRHGEGARQVMAMEALIDYQVHVGEQLVPYYLWLMDVGKYGLGIVGTHWDEDFATVSRIEEVEDTILGVSTGRSRKKKITERVPGYVGNRIYNVRPFDFFPDPRVPINQFQRGEFVGVYREVGWNEVLEREESGFYTNLDRLRPGDRGGTAERTDGSSQLELPENDDPHFGDSPRNDTGVVKLYECYIELVPSKWGLGRGDMPEKWVFTTTADWKTVLGAQPLGAYHNKFPYAVLEFEPEAYALANRGIPEILDPVQRTLDWLINTHFYNVRKALNDQFIVDPSRVVMKDVTDPLPGGIIRLKPSAFGTKPSDAIEQLRVVDLTQGHMQDLSVMLEMGQRTLGVSDQMLGSMSQTGRKTAQEVRTSSTFGISRLKTTSEYFSAMGWVPLSQMMVQNSQQYYDQERKFRIVGDLVLEAGEQFVNVSPSDIQGFYDYVPVDGTLPIDRFAQANLWRELMAQMAKVPQVAAQYDIGRIFGWVAQLAGLKNINQFKIQAVPDATAAAQAQQGNLIQLPAGRSPEVVPEPGQISGLGTTG